MWFKKKVEAKPKDKLVLPDGLWVKCEGCGEILYRKELEKTIWICPKCNFHFRISSRKYIELLLDEGKLEEFDTNLESKDPLNFPKYKEKLKAAQDKTKMKEGVIIGLGTIGGHNIIFAVTNFEFMGGSMGSVVGEKITRALRRAREEKKPIIILTASGGGARMQEGILSLMQMVKTSAEVALLNKEGILYINILTHPTMAGVMASFASLGDIIIAEPSALLGFTGPRVIEQTIGQKLPPGFQRSEFLLKHGMIDIVGSRKDLKNTIVRILNIINING